MFYTFNYVSFMVETFLEGENGGEEREACEVCDLPFSLPRTTTKMGGNDVKILMGFLNFWKISDFFFLPVLLNGVMFSICCS